MSKCTNDLPPIKMVFATLPFLKACRDQTLVRAIEGSMVATVNWGDG
jgi:hypothetical protein